MKNHNPLISGPQIDGYNRIWQPCHQLIKRPFFLSLNLSKMGPTFNTTKNFNNEIDSQAP